jgi:hypothetical protein
LGADILGFPIDMGYWMVPKIECNDDVGVAPLTDGAPLLHSWLEIMICSVWLQVSLVSRSPGRMRTVRAPFSPPPPHPTLQCKRVSAIAPSGPVVSPQGQGRSCKETRSLFPVEEPQGRGTQNWC